jgi:hypothetical protein
LKNEEFIGKNVGGGTRTYWKKEKSTKTKLEPEAEGPSKRCSKEKRELWKDEREGGGRRRAKSKPEPILHG